jgi:hypothetical protein
VSRFPLAIVAGVAFVSATVTATVIVPTDFKDVVTLSTIIVRGHVTDTRGIVRPEGGIETVVTVAVDSVIKGQPDGFVSLRLPGGQVGNSRMVTIGAPTLKVGQQAVLFLKPGPDNALRPVALSMGVYPVLPDATSGRFVVLPPPVAGRTMSGRTIVRGDVRRKPISVQEFEALVKLVMTAPRAVPRTAATARGRGGGR